MKSTTADSSDRSPARATACETYSVREVADRLGYSVQTIYRGIKAHVIPVVDLGARNKRVPKHFVDKALHKRGSGASDAGDGTEGHENADGTQTDNSETEKS